MAAADDGTDPRYFCRWCDGEGKIASNHSEAKYDCERCEGTGLEPPCEECGGEGVVLGGVLAARTLDGMIPCSTCQGSHDEP